MRFTGNIVVLALMSTHGVGAYAECSFLGNPSLPAIGPDCYQMEQVTILGKADGARDVAGGASVVEAGEIEAFSTTDIVRAIRRVPGVSLQVEDGYGLRPNISIRGTATERSSRVTLLEDNVLIAPAPYASPSAYYFPTFGRIRSVEVLKGPAAITQGPYTVGGAINLVATPIPAAQSGHLTAEAGSDDTWRVHAWYGDSRERTGYLIETHQWQSGGYQHIDRSDRDTGLDKEDYLARLRFSSQPGSEFAQSVELKLQASSEISEQSYLGLTDANFRTDALRRYATSALDVMDNEHEQVSATWRIEIGEATGVSATAYYNGFERAWYKTEGIDFDGSTSPGDFESTGWARVIRAINLGDSLAGLDAGALQAILDGADTAPGSIQLRNNAREYYSQGVQLGVDHVLEAGRARHELRAGLRFHEDEEDRLQRNDNYRQSGGQLVLDETGQTGNAGNRVQSAEAWAFFVQDRIETGRWTLSPGVRFESIEQHRVDYATGAPDPSRRDPSRVTGTRSNDVDVWIPGLGAIYDLTAETRLVGGVHKGFSTPGNQPDVEPEESVNYEFGLRHEAGALQLEIMGFFNDYENLVGVCTNSSGSGCEPGDAFNGEGVDVPGLEASLRWTHALDRGWSLPVQFAYTWMDAEFESSFDSEFFGEVRSGDPVPYIPEHQAWASLGLETGALSAYVSANYVDAVCTQASCGPFERTESATIVDVAVHWSVAGEWQVYAVVENLSDETYIAGREPYGARTNKPRSFTVGTRFDF